MSPIEKKTLAIFVSIVVVVAIIAYGFGWWSNLPAEEERARLVLRVGLHRGIDSLDPVNVVTGMMPIIMSPVYEGLVSFDENTSLVPTLATSWEIVDPLTWRFQIREGVKFHDGTPLNASAVKYNFDRLLDPTRSKIFGEYDWLDRVEVEDEYTILIITKEPNPAVDMSMPRADVYIVSPTAIEKYGGEWLGTHAVGTGPYKVVERETFEYAKLEKFDDYWRGKPIIDEIIFYEIDEAEVRYLKFKAQEIDIATSIPAEFFPDLAKLPYGHLELTSLSTLMVWYNLNPWVPPLDDIRVRKAIWHSIDRYTIATTVLGGLGGPQNIIWPTVAEGRLPEDYFGPDGPYPYDPDKARSLLEEAGWVDTDGDGIREKNGEKLSIKFNTHMGETYKDLAVSEATLPYLKEVGIDVKLEVLEPGMHWGKVASPAQKDLQMWIITWTVPSSWPLSWVMQWLVINPETGKTTWTYINDKEISDLSVEALSTMDRDERMTIWHEVQVKVTEWAVVKPMYNLPIPFAVNNKVKNLTFTHDYAYILHYENLDIEE